MSVLSKRITAAVWALYLAGSFAWAEEPGLMPAGTYRLDPGHTSVTFSVDHLGLAQFTAGFDRVEATLDIDPANPGLATLNARIDVSSLDLPDPGQGFYETMMGPAFFEAETHPDITFAATGIAISGPLTAEVTGDLTIRGVTQPVILATRAGAGYPPGFLEATGRIGFSAETEIRRSDFGMTFGIPAPGTRLGVGNAVTIRIETEFTGPD